MNKNRIQQIVGIGLLTAVVAVLQAAAISPHANLTAVSCQQPRVPGSRARRPWSSFPRLS